MNTDLSVGDSTSIDLYPGFDLQERQQLDTVPSGLGAASLLYENDDTVGTASTSEGGVK